MKTLLVAAALAAGSCTASTLYTASYAGLVSSLSLSSSGDGAAHLSLISNTSDCGPSPSWLMLDGAHGILYCLDEAINAPNGSITSFKTHPNGTLTTIEHLKTLTGPVQSVLYNASGVSDRQFMAVAHYDASTITTYSVDPIHGLFNRSQTFTYNMTAPGPNASRQDAPHPHGVVVDPTGRFVLSPDLGADFVRIFAVDQATGLLQPQEPLKISPGSGPRHAVFWTPKEKRAQQVYMYLVSELANTLSAFKVTYTSTGISFTKVYEESTYGGDKSGPDGSKVAEIAISPENNHIVTTNRLDNTFGKNNDSFAIFSCADATGNKFTKPAFLGLNPTYGSNPRQFEINGQRTLVAVAMQDTKEVVVTKWDAKKGAPGALVASKKMEGEIPAAIWG
ncbi:hypothetical protein ASPWEDRAFT_173700 [Aspergillus wentii DTO 134E9]|uniref:6-phosphogluconolactonase n=1 Tax=Aspergillus wentii DTO 134E9 TaxID=1073089 RepID=A0A1L9RHD0_ASPWE|nr:uncharacterized protein ASPWEDRAFT_173700 [Aspergillus wentii DTO 134E9]OJJ34278.1 hypothetical protein ASPWEDRAFT_173700 [Aspergillus wentii DTO 134E9]